MKKGLILYGVGCTSAVWDEFQTYFGDFAVTYAAYPHEITQTAHTASDVTKWVYARYGRERFDFIAGHSMGGIIALELAARYQMSVGTVILIETNLRPAGSFYRTLLLPANTPKYGERLKAMFREEAPYYTGELKASIQEGFDFSEYLFETDAAVFGVYGDRGVPNYAGRIGDLCLSRAAAERIRFRFVENSAHMPMIENPHGLAAILRDCISPQQPPAAGECRSAF